MKKHPDSDDLLDEYDFSNGLRGKFSGQYAQGSNVVVLSPDVAEVFPIRLLLMKPCAP